MYEDARAIIMKLAYASEMEVGDAFEIAGAVTVVTNDAKVYLPMEELVDKAAETARLKKELASAEKQLAAVHHCRL